MLYAAFQRSEQTIHLVVELNVAQTVIGTSRVSLAIVNVLPRHVFSSSKSVVVQTSTYFYKLFLTYTWSLVLPVVGRQYRICAAAEQNLRSMFKGGKSNLVMSC